MKCTHCNGKGKIKTSLIMSEQACTWMTCQVCKGTGIIDGKAEMSLSEKAKTLEQWYEEFAIGEETEVLLVRLEDARQEIDKLKKDCKEKSEGYAKVCARLHEHVMDLEGERGEQKQKLQQMLKLWDNQGHLGIVLQETDWLLGEFGQLRKLGVLKE